MGAGQSSSGHSQAAAGEVKTSYYELLGLEKSATDVAIKKAYRQKALSLHPDRNYGREEAATAEFAAVQSAYEVLSDPQERAWYDSHEDAILRDIDPSAADGGGYESSVGLTTADEVTRQVRKFNGNVSYDDSPNGFFGFLREFFEQLAKEEDQAALREDVDVRDYSSFGHKDDTHEDVVSQFYGAWAGFSTVKSFSWRDKYRASDAEDRRMRRLIEKENARFRKEGIAEFNEAVRSLVAFVRKRDPRYKADTRTEAERVKTLQDASRAQATRMRAANAAKTEESALPAWVRSAEDDQPVGKGVEEGTFDEESSEEEHFECMACRKTFKSEKQYETHEKSNKHKKAVQALRRKLEKEGQLAGVDEEEDADEPPKNEPEVEQTDEYDRADEEPGEERLAARPDVGNDETSADLSAKLEDNTLNDTAQSTNHDRNPDASPSTSATPSRSPSRSPSPALASGTPATEPTTETSEPSALKKGKAAQKREKRAAKAAAAEAEDNKHKCANCGAAFPSKTRLHQHLKDFGHAAPPSQGRYGQPGKVAGKKKKDRNI